jgi:hypothetical protein
MQKLQPVEMRPASRRKRRFESMFRTKTAKENPASGDAGLSENI